MEFRGVVKPARRGGWTARGLLVEQRFGQIFETQVGPKQFDSEGKGDAWLRAAARGLEVEAVRIVIGGASEAASGGRV